MSVSVTQISIPSESDGTFFLKVDWVEDLGAGFTVALCDGESAWMGEVSEEDVVREAEELEMRRERYVEELQLALAGAGGPGGAYAFQLSSESPLHSRARRLAYEKVQMDISFRLGSVELLPCPEPSRVIMELVSHGLENSRELRARNQHLKEENQRLGQEQHRVTTELERYVEDKENLERELYMRFVLVLNEKKARIRCLQEKLRQLQEEQEKRGNRDASTAESSAAVEADDGASTDEEGTQTVHWSQASTVLLRDVTSPCSTDTDLSDTPDVAPTRKRRWRHPHGPGSEVVKDSQGLQQTGRKDSAHSKADSNQATTQETAAVAPPSCSQADNLFDDF